MADQSPHANEGLEDTSAMDDTLLEPEIVYTDEFTEYCLDLYEVIKYGKRKDRKRAAQRLVTFAVSLAEAVENLATKLHDAEKKNTVWHDHPPASSKPEDRGPDPSHLYTETGEETRSCVINEHAHGDDLNWAHVDKDVDEKLKEEEEERWLPLGPDWPATDGIR